MIEIAVARTLRSALVETTIGKAREAERSRDMLLGMVSHDLRNPLGAISLAAVMLQTGNAEPAHITRASARIAASSNRMLRMIEQLLDYTRARAGTLELNLQKIDLVVLCRQLVEETEGAYPGFSVALHLPETCMFECDPDRMAQVLSNLLGNARQHGDLSQPVRLTLECDEEKAVLEIQNHGAPISPERLPTLFEPFKRAQEQKHGPTRAELGLGLGLYIVYRLVEMHRGTIAVASSAEHGTTCTLTFPRIKA